MYSVRSSFRGLPVKTEEAVSVSEELRDRVRERYSGGRSG
jgi:hypothetical protein